MKNLRSFGRCFVLLLVLFVHKGYVTAKAFTGTYGINYGRIANNIPTPNEVVRLLKAAKIKNVRIYDADHTVLEAFRGSGLDLVIGLPNEFVKDMSSNADHALTWVTDNVKAYISNTHIVGIAVGNEVLGGSDLDLQNALYGAVKNIYNATQKLQLDKVVQITTAHSQAVFANSYPPSSCVFKEDVAQNMKKLLDLFTQMGSPFCLNAYPFLAYMGSPDQIDINYALFNPTDGVDDEKTNLHYDNMLDAQIDAAYAALEDAGFGKMEVIVTETGWASDGDENEGAATPENARTYNYNLRKRLAKRKGTPRRPKSMLKAYIFALFNENSKPGPTSERNFGLYKPDGTIAYDIGFPALKSSSSVSSRLSFKVFGAQTWHWSYISVLTACASSSFLFLRS
ncbi:glucan endo-1,3-beta-glucosidase 14 [Helianthus annuus]|uniref:glucan endo-1,3-beta-D-glucosidase n=1 Tax=Helianthus annuus TaxID=4232 RepID=A0A251TT39_HELAN|nr:glucan endo-1,3-beta-glucosidase 14 [Helianthus annuus]